MRIRDAIAATALLGVSAAIAFAACVPSSDLNVTDYNQSCTQDSDCTPVETGNVCNSCCANVAINKSDLAQWQSDRAAVDCSESFIDCAPCPAVAFCRSATGAVGASVKHCDVRLADAGQ